MKQYRCPLMTSGVFLMIFCHQPVMAVEDSQTSLETLDYQDIGDLQQGTKDILPRRTPSLLEKLSAELGKVETQSEKDGLAIMASELSQEESTPPSSFLAQVPSYSPAPPTYSPPPGQTFQAPGSMPARPSGPNSDVLVPNPEVIIRSNGSSIPDSLQPTMPVAPTLPRAIAPPVGDMAISNIDAGASQVDLGSSAVVPRLVLRQAPAREVLAVLARFAGMNLVFTDTPGGGQGQEQGGAEPTVSLDLENEPVEDVFNAVLMISGLQANRRGRTVFVGSRLPQAARTLVSRTLRLNQVKSANAGVFLASQGAEFQRLVTQTEDIIDPLTQRVVGRRELPSTLESLTSQADDDSAGPMLLKGLTVSSDDRLNTVTLVGEPRDVQVATSLLTQMDARRRQVAVNVKVVDVTLTNDQSFSSNFSFGSGDTFVVQDDGAAVLRFGGFSPVNGDDINSAPGRVINPPVIDNPLIDGNTFIDFNRSVLVPGQGGGTLILDDFGNLIRVREDAQFFGRVAGVSLDPSIAGITEITPGTPDTFQRTFDPETGISTTTISPGTVATATSALPSFFQFPKRFLAQIETN